MPYDSEASSILDSEASSILDSCPTEFFEDIFVLLESFVEKRR